MKNITLNDEGQGGELEHKKLIHAKSFIMKGIAEGKPKEAVEAYVGNKYIQHAKGIKSGVGGFIDFFSNINERFPNRDIKIIRGWEDGEYVFLHIYQNLNNGEYKFISTDFFKTDQDDKLVEHWEVLSEFEGLNPSGRTQIDGVTEFTDLNHTEENKVIVRSMLENCLFPNAKPDRIEEWFAEPYIQHNPNVGDGLDVVRELSQIENRPLIYHDIVLMVGKGNFVATLCKATWEGNPLDQVDIVRLENGKIVEHWDLTQSVTEK